MNYTEAPALYLKYRNECYRKKRKNGKLSSRDKKECQKQAAIRYYKKTGKPVRHAFIEAVLNFDKLFDNLKGGR